MSTDSTVIPIRTPSPRRAKPGLVLAESAGHKGFDTHDVVAGLHGVCTALDVVVGDSPDVDTGELAIAARVLVSILRSRES